MTQVPRESMPRDYRDDDLPRPDASPGEWDIFMAKLAARRTPLHRTLIQICAERREVAQAAAAGDRAAVKLLGALNARQIETVAKLDVLACARAVARERQALAAGTPLVRELEDG